MSAHTPWGHGGSGAPEGDDWVWEYSPVDPETGVPEEDGRLFHAPPEVAAVVVQRVNAFDDLVNALTLCVAWMPAAEVRSWPPGFRLRTEALAAARAALAKARSGSPGTQT